MAQPKRPKRFLPASKYVSASDLSDEPGTAVRLERVGSGVVFHEASGGGSQLDDEIANAHAINLFRLGLFEVFVIFSGRGDKTGRGGTKSMRNQ